MKGDFNKLINGEIPVLIDFYATWCAPCKAQTPIIKQIVNEINGKVRIIKIDIDKNQTIAQRYQIKGVPTLALFKNGQIVWRQSGVQTKNTLLAIIQQYA